MSIQLTTYKRQVKWPLMTETKQELKFIHGIWCKHAYIEMAKYAGPYYTRTDVSNGIDGSVILFLKKKGPPELNARHIITGPKSAFHLKLQDMNREVADCSEHDEM
jgi:hypothetical protein